VQVNAAWVAWVGAFQKVVLKTLSQVTSKPASRGRIKTGHSEEFYSYEVS